MQSCGSKGTLRLTVIVEFMFCVDSSLFQADRECNGLRPSPGANYALEVDPFDAACKA